MVFKGCYGKLECVFFPFAMSTIAMCRDFAFSNSGLKVWLPAFQLPIFAKCDALPKRDLFDMFVSGIHSRHSFWEFQASTPYQKLEVPESRSTAVRSTRSALRLHHAHPFVAAAEKTYLIQRSRGFGHGVVVSRTC